MKRQHSSSTLLQNLEQEWTCPITNMPLKDPVITDDGVTYEKQYILKWLQKESISPKTGLSLRSKQIRPNITLKSLIQRIHQEIPRFEKRYQEQKSQLQDHIHLQQKNIRILIQIISQSYQLLSDMLKKQEKLQTPFQELNTYKTRFFLLEEKVLKQLQSYIIKPDNQKAKILLQYQLKQQILIDSSIIKTKQQVQKLMSFFPQNVKSMSLLFKASQNDFSLSKYNQLCGQINNTLIICETQNSKIIGGYTPLAFNPANYIQMSQQLPQEYSWQPVPDNTNTSFLFSLTNNDKFILNDNRHAISRYYNQKTFKITFGSKQFEICDFSNINKESCTSWLNTFYYNENYRKYDKDSYLRLNGNESQKFLTKQWEIWRVQFFQNVQQPQKNDKKILSSQEQKNQYLQFDVNSIYGLGLKVSKLMQIIKNFYS